MPQREATRTLGTMKWVLNCHRFAFRGGAGHHGRVSRSAPSAKGPGLLSSAPRTAFRVWRDTHGEAKGREHVLVAPVARHNPRVLLHQGHSVPVSFCSQTTSTTKALVRGSRLCFSCVWPGRCAPGFFLWGCALVLRFVSLSPCWFGRVLVRRVSLRRWLGLALAARRRARRAGF